VENENIVLMVVFGTKEEKYKGDVKHILVESFKIYVLLLL
jgi:hypothetical protein